MDDDRLDILENMTTMPPGNVTQPPYVDYRDELLFDPDEIEEPGNTGGYRLPGDSVVDVSSGKLSLASGANGGVQQQNASNKESTSTASTPPPYTINLLDEEKESKRNTSGDMTSRQWIVIAVAVAIICLMILAYFAFFRNKTKAQPPGPVDPLAPYY